MEKLTRFKDIPQFTRDGNYQVDMDIRRVPEWIKNEQEEMGLQLNQIFSVDIFGMNSNKYHG